MRDGRRTERRVLTVVALALAYVGYRVFTRYWDYGVAAGELPQAVRDYRASELPWTAADLGTGGVPTAQNAAEPLRRALAAWPKGSGSIGWYDPALSRAYENGTVSTLFSRYVNALALAHEAAKRPHLDFDRDWDQGPFLETPESSGIKAMVRMLAARAASRAKAGEDAGALVDLEDARRLAVLVGQEPEIIPALVSAACHRVALASVRVCLAQAAGDPTRLSRYRRWLAAPTPLPDLRRAFRGAIYSTVATARNFDRMGVGQGALPFTDILPFVDGPEMLGNPSHPFPIMRHDGSPGNTRSQAYMARCLQMWTELARETHGLADIDEVGIRTEAILDHHEEEHRMSHGFDAMLFPSYAHLGDANRGVEASRNLGLAYADALLLHATTGRWPTATPYNDPLGKGLLKVRRDGKGFRVWSVGKDRKDDGGLTSKETIGSNRSSDDEVAAFPPG